MTTERTTRIAALALAGALGLAGAATAQMANPTVGGAEMMADRPIAENASAAPNLSTLVAAAEAAGLVETLAGEGEYTVFAPTDEAFAALPEGTVETLLMPENREELRKVLLAHVLPGTVTAEDAMGMIGSDGGQHDTTTASGDALTLGMRDGSLIVFDESGGTATVTTADVMQSNGVVHVVDSVLLPR